MSPDDARNDDEPKESAGAETDQPSELAPPAPEPEAAGAEPRPDDADNTQADPSPEARDEPRPEPEAVPASLSLPRAPHGGLTIIDLSELEGSAEDIGPGDDDDEDAEGGEYDDEDDDAPRTVLVTGAGGVIGRKLQEAWADYYDLILVDREPDPENPDLIVADLSQWDDEWVGRFDGVDTVVHLAGNAEESASWASLTRTNIDATNNVLMACALGGVERIVFASSLDVLAGYRDEGDLPITADLPPRPVNAQGATKLMGERLGRAFSTGFDLTFVALRLGLVQPGANDPDALPDAWSRSIWLSDEDLIHLFESAVEADLGEETFVVVHGISDNRGTRWDLSGAESIGYAPEDDSVGDGNESDTEAEADIDAR